MAESQQPWYAEFFDGTMAEILENHRDEKELDATAAFLISALNLKPGDRVYDQCCGTGTISRALAQKDIVVVGVDQAQHYIDRAKKLANEMTLSNVFFEAGDAFKYVAPQPCEGVFNWWSSFGFLEDDDKNAEMLARAYDSLKPGGRFAMDYMNARQIVENFHPVIQREREVHGRKVQVTKHSTIEGDMIFGRWVYEPEDGGAPQELHDQAKLYTVKDLKAMLAEAGFRDIQLESNIMGEPYSSEAPRCILIGQKPELG